MAISDLSLFNSMAFALDTTTANIQSIQQSLASGKRVVQPSDNLVNYGQAQLLSARDSAVTNDINTGTQVQGLLTSADNALSNVGNWVNSASSIATQGADGTMSTAQMSTLATQVQSILTQVTGAANTEYAGAYMFGGSQTNAAPTTPAPTTSAIRSPTSPPLATAPRFKRTFDGSRSSAMRPPASSARSRRFRTRFRPAITPRSRRRFRRFRLRFRVSRPPEETSASMKARCRLSSPTPTPKAPRCRLRSRASPTSMLPPPLSINNKRCCRNRRWSRWHRASAKFRW